ncbi:PAS domain-containing protein [Fastidiosibacter lacustris]|uniref:PAS domain-containing protein n=1 Tax=Fastidiosibacter lacustris TaxID=2056695 RepID=UPI000E3442FD|nr:PAS domain-containing protein [Fastidiosibacter lacustris]
MPVDITTITPSFEEFADMIPQPIYGTDLQHKVTFMNKFAVKAANINSEKNWLGVNAFDVYPKEIAVKLTKNRNDVINYKKQIHCEEIVKDQITGDTKIFDTTIAPWRNKKGEVIGTLNISIDITERKKLETETIQQKNQLEKKLEYQRAYLKSYGYDYVESLKVISQSLENIEHRLMKLDIPNNVRTELNDEFYNINESLSDIYSLYQKINTSILDQDKEPETNQIPLYLQELIQNEVNLADASISAEFDVSVSFDMDEKSKQKLYVDYKKIRHVIRTLFANYTKAIDRDSRKKDIRLTITAEDGMKDKLYVTFEFDGNMPFLELEDGNIRAEHLVYKSQSHIATDKHNFAYDLSLAKYYADLLCDGEELNDSLFEGPRFSFTLPFRKVENDGNAKVFKPVLIK